MQSFTAGVRDGNWVTAERVRAYSVILLILAVIAIIGLGLTAEGLNDYKGRPLGTDFSNVYAAGKWVLEGRPEAPFNPPLQHEMEKRLFGADTPFFGWHYPPVFLGLAAVLALLPYLPALVVWQVTTLAGYLAMVRGIVAGGSLHGVKPRNGASIAASLWLLPALAFPAVFVNLTHGHNGFLTAALFGGSLLLLDRRPASAGILIGLLCYKPQFGMLIPLVLAATGRWRVFFTAAATVVVVCALSWLAFGTSTWIAFGESLQFTRTVVLEQGGTGFHKIQSPFAALRMWGVPAAAAYAIQAATIGAVAVLLVTLWRSGAPFATKAAALLAGSLLATPYVLDYDLMLMAPAVAFLAVHGIAQGFLNFEKSALVLCWFAPLLARVVGEHAGVPIGVMALFLLFGVALRRGAADRAAAPPTSFKPGQSE